MNFKNVYSAVNGISMYYEIHGEGEPLVLVHGGGSTISTSFGEIIPMLAEDFRVIAVELQAMGTRATGIVQKVLNRMQTT
jgi:pimeloyl-ACP methyl ester carboxylesterase